MSTYKVWDPENESEGDASEIIDASPRSAARAYAEQDSDGHIAGIYAEWKELHVLAPDGVLHVLAVKVEYVPRYHVSET